MTFTSTRAEALFDHSVKCFIEDYMVEKMPLEQSGWRSLNEVSKHLMVSGESLLGRNGAYGPSVRELISRGLIEARIFKGQRGRGGNVVKVRLAYDKEPVKRYVDRTVLKPK